MSFRRNRRSRRRRSDIQRGPGIRDSLWIMVAPLEYRDAIRNVHIPLTPPPLPSEQASSGTTKTTDTTEPQESTEASPVATVITTKTTETTKGQVATDPAEPPPLSPGVAWRVEAMQGQIVPGQPVPFLTARPGSGDEWHCLSCDDLLGGRATYRCASCAVAARVVLDRLRG